MAFGEDKPKTGTAKGLLTQIHGLLDQYIDLGESTPLFEDAQAFRDDVQRGLDQLSGEMESPSEDTAEGGESTESGANSSSPSDFRSATKNARAKFEARRDGNSSSDGQPKTDESEQAMDEESKRRTKAY